MYGICIRYAPDRSMADDFLQEGFIRIFMKLDSFKSQGSLEGWMRRIMVNTALELLRKKDILRQSIEITNSNVSASDLSQPFSQDSESYLTEIYSPDDIYNAMLQMPVGFRTVFNLFVVEEYSHKTIGEMLGISEGTSKSQFSRARAWLQKKLNEKKTPKNAR